MMKKYLLLTTFFVALLVFVFYGQNAFARTDGGGGTSGSDSFTANYNGCYLNGKYIGTAGAKVKTTLYRKHGIGAHRRQAHSYQVEHTCGRGGWTQVGSYKWKGSKVINHNPPPPEDECSKVGKKYYNDAKTKYRECKKKQDSQSGKKYLVLSSWVKVEKDSNNADDNNNSSSSNNDNGNTGSSSGVSTNSSSNSNSSTCISEKPATTRNIKDKTHDNFLVKHSWTEKRTVECSKVNGKYKWVSGEWKVRSHTEPSNVSAIEALMFY